MEFSEWEQGQTIYLRGFNHCCFGFLIEPKLRFVRAMSGVNGFDFDRLGADQAADDFAEAVAAVAHGEDFELIVRADGAPALGDGFGGLAGGQGSFEFVRYDQDFQRGIALPGDVRKGKEEPVDERNGKWWAFRSGPPGAGRLLAARGVLPPTGDGSCRNGLECFGDVIQDGVV